MPHVLVVDDDKGFSEICMVALRHEGHAVDTADSVKGALGSLATHVPDAIILDWKLLDGTGLDVLRWIKVRNLQVPTAIVTGFWAEADFSEASAEAIALGAAECIRRGIDWEDPTDIVRRLLDALGYLHAAVLREDAQACDKLAKQLTSRLVSRLQGAFRRTPREMVSDAVTDAIVEHLRRPAVFDSRYRVSVENFVYVAARRNLVNAIRAERRQFDRIAAYAATAMVVATPVDNDSDREALIECALDQEPDQAVRRSLRLWLDGDRTIKAWMAVPRFESLSPLERRRDVKRIKDAFLARGKRISRRSHRVH